jgi:hypothetical protein
VIFYFKKLISAWEDMKIKKNTFSTLVLELFSHSLQTVGNWKSKIDFPYPTAIARTARVAENGTQTICSSRKKLPKVFFKTLSSP